MSSQNWAIRVEGVSKKFGLSLQQSMHYGLRDTLRMLAGKDSHTEMLRAGEFWAVRDINFELHPGEALGIMGVNGCGKTTLLRMLNGVYAPDTGRIQIKGRVGALIAAGAGFAPMLSGRENVYVNGTLLGLSTREIDLLMDEIVAFAELGDFIDLPVKNYSSGMYVRLGFAIAALSRPDVLLMDEVLAVGDLNFQKKCYDYILQLKRNGTAIILVSHSPGAIWAVCDRGIFMNHGSAEFVGHVEDVVRLYDDQNARNALRSEAQFDIATAEHKAAAASEEENAVNKEVSGTGDVTCTDFRILDARNLEPIEEVRFKEDFVIQVVATVVNPVEDFILRIVVDAVHYRNILSIDNYEQGQRFEALSPGTYTFSIHIKNQNLRPGAYTFNLAVVSKHVGAHLFLWLRCCRILVLSPHDKFLYSEPNAVMHVDATYLLET